MVLYIADLPSICYVAKGNSEIWSSCPHFPVAGITGAYKFVKIMQGWGRNQDFKPTRQTLCPVGHQPHQGLPS